jgi:hypothetical protein
VSDQPDRRSAQPRKLLNPVKGGGASGPHGATQKPDLPKEIGGPKGPEPTRFGDWEKDGRCSDF